MLISCAWSAAAPDFQSPWRKRNRVAADPSRSARFLPADIQISDPSRAALWRASAARLPRDSTRHWEIRGDRLRISYDMLQDLAGGNLPNTGGALSDRAAAWLAKSHGGSFRSSGIAFGTYLPDDEWLLASPQWSLRNTGAPFGDRPGKAGVDIGIEKVWDKFAGSDSLVVAVLDAGFDFRHSDLKGRNWVNQAESGGLPGIDDDANGYVDDSLGWDFVDDDNLPQDCHGHGTMVSSVIAAGFDNRQGIAGILAAGRIMPIRVLDASGHGSESQIAKGIRYAIRNGAHAINFSIGGSGDHDDMRSAFQAARDAGVPIVVAAGNDARDLNAQPAYPASYNYENMLVVAAHDHAGLLCSFSNFGRTAAHLAAPGELILVAGIPDPIRIFSEDFETGALRWTSSGGSTGLDAFALSPDKPAAGAQSLAWVSGNNASAVSLDTIDLTAVKGATIRFKLDFKPVNMSDVVIVEGRKMGSTVWTEIAVVGSTLTPASILAFGLQELDGSRFNLRFRTALASRFSAAARVLKIDDVEVYVPDPAPPAAPVFTVVAGTSVAAPHVAAYLGLQRLACDRMGLAWTRARALAGVVPESSLAGKVSTGGRLDAYKGLEFYLSTLPDFRVFDSTANTWKGGEKVAYALSLSPSPQQTYVFSETGLPQGAVIDGAGNLTWTPNSRQAGEYTVRLRADGPTVLRKVLRFTVLEESRPVAAVPPYRPDAGLWRVAGRDFRLPAGIGSGNHRVEVYATNAAGKVQLLKRAWVDASVFSHPAAAEAFPLLRGTVPARIQVSVDGIFLPVPR
jgi:hypothetical protein